jgi:hypothetical protein
MSTFMGCQRKYKLTYLDKLTVIRSTADRALFLGSAFHAGMEAALTQSLYSSILPSVEPEYTDRIVSKALVAARLWLRDNTPEGQTRLDYQTRQEVPDVAFYQMMTGLETVVTDMLRYYIPQLKLGTDWVVVTRGEVLGNPKLTAPAIEWEFDAFEIEKGFAIKGKADAVLRSKEGEYVLFDWKTRKAIPDDLQAQLDGQLHLYAAVLRKMGAPISRVIMCQMRTGLPNPAKLSTAKKTMGEPLTDAKGYDSTWEMWSSTLPAGIDPAKYEAIMKPKLHPASDYLRFVEGFVTSLSSARALRNAYNVMKSMDFAATLGDDVPAVLGSNACSWCPFARLCANSLRYGGDPSEVVAEYYLTDDE